ncbi:hypothetical protein MG293_003569 [Ovis ammon polii]|uniref:Uncharacterized protein n=1 Tax=Ovis ammon polii TaxID=230172 RepID=A0AAD4YGB0_OVIAM|nr:hypothetical protein MG293_003569 [Ovis ammon polii]
MAIDIIMPSAYELEEYQVNHGTPVLFSEDSRSLARIYLRYMNICGIFPKTWHLTMKELLSGNGDSADPGGLELDLASSIYAACVAEWIQREFGVSLSHPVNSFTGQLLTNGHFSQGLIFHKLLLRPLANPAFLAIQNLLVDLISLE